MIIKTDHKWKSLLYGYQLTEKEKSEFDYMEQINLESSAFVRYKGIVYAISEFIRVEDPEGDLSEWDGYYTGSAFHAVVIKISDSGEEYMIGGYYQ